MDNMTNRYLSVSYKLFIDGDNGRELVEETTADKPFTMITGFGYSLDELERQLGETPAGSTFSIALTKDQAYGDYDEKLLMLLDREVFSVNGHFDHDNIYPDAIVPLQDEQGKQYYARVLEVGDEKVKVDLNHPLAGETLYFEGVVTENREATKQEIDHLVKHLTGGCCCGHDHGDDGCCCGHDHGDDCDCGHHHDHDDDCCCGHHHEHGGCGHHHNH